MEAREDSAEVRARLLGGARRLVVKLGSSLLAPEGKSVRTERLAALAAQVSELHAQGREVVLVSSGAIALGVPLAWLTARRSSSNITGVSAPTI